MTNQPNIKQERSSNLELYRIIVMLLIVAHHSIVNSGVYGCALDNPLEANSIFAFLFGMWGKTGINCFVMITGYFMCTSHITGRKFVKLVLEVLFYNVVIYGIFALTGYTEFSLSAFARKFWLVGNMTDGFISAFIMFYLFIPFLNKLVHALSQKEHALLIGLCLLTYTLLPHTLIASIQINYVLWFSVIYIVASFLRLHPVALPKSKNAGFWGWMALGSVVLSMLSVVANLWIRVHVHRISPYLWVADSNAILAVVTAVCTFMWFKNLRIKQSRVINTIAASTFGVLCIHANSDMMRQWLWVDITNMQDVFRGGYFAGNAILVVLIVFVVCVLLDYIRIQCIEKPVFKLLDNKLANCKWW